MPFRLMSRSVFLALAAVALLILPAQAANAQAKPNPDFTKGETRQDDAKHDWNLGPTGARGWMYNNNLTTHDARQILITKIDKGSPAEGVLQVGDVILGIGEERFSYNARAEFAKAITQAETFAGGGKLKLMRWRDGQTQTATLTLPVLGSYARTAPYGCVKSNRILEQGCAALAEQMMADGYRRNAIERSLNALALLASGDEQYLPLVKREAEWAASYQTNGFQAWWYSYALMLMAEYVMETGDQSIMPGLTRMATEVANGQSHVGSWGHGFANPDGRLRGYGMMNAPGLTLTIGLVLAKEAGVDDPVVAEAIEKSATLLRFYIDKGSIPYGDHDPWIQTHDDNGKNGAAAVLFNLLGDREAATYFSRMSVASHGPERECGHTGNYLNILWAMPGINPSGPNATGAWMDAYGNWYYDLARRWDGTYRHQGPAQTKLDSWNNWDASGVYLLAYAMPKGNLRLTGKGRSIVPRLTRAEADDLIDDGRGWDNVRRNQFYDSLSEGELVDRLKSWSPVVRERAAMALGRRKAEVLPQLLELLKSDDRYSQYGACQAFKYFRGQRDAAVPVLLKTVESEDKWLRIMSAKALAGIGEPARRAIPALLERLAKADFDGDPRGMEQRYLCFSLFDRRGGLLGKSVDGVDRDLLRQAIVVGLKNEDGRARGAVANIYDQLSFEEIRPLLPAIYEAVMQPAPSGIMFASQVREAGLDLLAKHRVEEGIEAAAHYCKVQNPWASQIRTPKIMQTLLKYGAHGEKVIPQLEALADDYADGEPDFPLRLSKEKEAVVRETIEKIKASNERPELIRLGLDQQVN